MPPSPLGYTTADAHNSKNISVEMTTDYTDQLTHN